MAFWMNGWKEEYGRKTNTYNRMSFEEGNRRRQLLLDKIHDGFTPKEASVIWCMKIPDVNAMTQKMRKYGMITSAGGRRSRIFYKVERN